MRLQHGAARARALFDDGQLVSCAGLVPVMRLAQLSDLHGIVGERVRIPGDKGANAGGKVAAVVAGMVAGADSIDDLDVLRHGGMKTLFHGVYAPSTVGSFLRSFSHGHVRQLQSAGREFLLQLCRRTPLLPGTAEVTFIDIDSVQRRVYGPKKRGASFGYAKVGGYSIKVRGLNALVATLSTPDAAPVIVTTRLRGGKAASARGAGSFAAEAIATTKAVLATQATITGAGSGVVVLRGDSAYYNGNVVAACRRAGVRFSVTMRVTAKAQQQINALAEDSWVDITYQQPIWDERQRRWIGHAQIAETTYTAFANTGQAVTARMIVRRVPDFNHQDALFPVWRYHAVFTDSPFVLVQAEAQHRRHAIIEQVFAELIDGPLAHMPSGNFDANQAWLTLAAMAHNLTRAAATVAGPPHATARAATIRRQLINVAARIARHARGITLHLPEHWPWQHPWQQLATAVHAPPG